VPGDREPARALFAMLADVFGEPAEPLTDGYIDTLLQRQDFWAIAAFAGDAIVGGVTAHTLPLTRAEGSEVFLYDIAVRPDHRRQGIGRAMIETLRDGAVRAGMRGDVFVAVDNDDAHALEFYRALGGAPAPVTVFSFTADE
jgi:aminoglycoside 3-N-acetyltransferase I